MYFLLGICLSLMTFLVVSHGAMCFVQALRFATATRLFADNFAAQTRARIFFWLGALPALAGAAAVLLFVVPSYLAFEPPLAENEIGWKMLLLAAAAFFLLARAGFRAAQSWQTTRLLTNDWRRRGEKIVLPDFDAPVYCFEHKFPVIAVVGIFRPQLFVARQVFHCLDKAEMTAAIAHEKNHLSARDNLKRFFLNFCDDLIFGAICGKSRNLWLEAAEIAADEAAARQTGNLPLAAGLIKLARLAALNSPPKFSAGAFLVAECGDLVVRRIRYLTDAPAAQKNVVQFQKSAFNICGIFIFAAIGTISFACLQTTHEIIERVVALLQ
jgi:Zn-dependent protease with chaperone function